MLDATIWKLEDNPVEVPFYLRRDFGESCLQQFIDGNLADDIGAFEQYVHWHMNMFARFYVDEIAPDASFQFSIPNKGAPYNLKYLESAFEMESPDGPILCEYYVNRWDYFIAASAAVRVIQ